MMTELANMWTARREAEGKQFLFAEVTPDDIVDFLIFKDVNGSGRTWVHDLECEDVGGRVRTQNCLVGCAYRHAAQSMRTGQYQVLKRGFEEFHMAGEWDPIGLRGNPVESQRVRQYIKYIAEEQARAGVTQKQAAVILRRELARLLRFLRALLYLPGLSVDERFRIYRDMCLFSAAFASTKRGDGLGNVLLKKIIFMPNKEGLIINFT